MAEIAELIFPHQNITRLNGLEDLSSTTIEDESAKPPVSNSPTKESTNAMESTTNLTPLPVIDNANTSLEVNSESWENFSFTE
jgi:hypothetical protein